MVAPGEIINGVVMELMKVHPKGKELDYDVIEYFNLEEFQPKKDWF